jgi:hypothetical protein
VTNKRKLPSQQGRSACSSLAKHAAAIRKLGKRVVFDVIQIGCRLAECKRLCGHGYWRPWLKSEFGWTERTAERFMSVHALVGKSDKLSDLELPLSGLYLLAAPSTPKEAVDEIVERAEAGEPVPVAEVKRIIEDTKGRKQPSSKPRKAMRASGTDPPQPSDEVPQQRAAAADRIRGLMGVAKPAPDRGDIGPDSAGEAGRPRARNEELESENRRLKGENIALRSEIKELKATGAMSITEFQTAIKKWEDTVETQRSIIARLENENAKLRAEVARPPPPDDGLDIPEILLRKPKEAVQ